MSNLETKEIPFYDDTLLGVRDEDGKIWLAIKKTCESLGFDERRAKAQRQKIKTDRILSKGGQNFDLPTKGGHQEAFCLHEKYVPLWLAKISLTRKMAEEIPEAVEKLERYQLEAANVLHKAFYETEEQKEAFHESLGLEGRFADVEEKLVEMSDHLSAQTEELHLVMDYMTINTTQQGKLLTHAKDRVRSLLGGAHSELYKKNSRKYFSNLWGIFKDTFVCSSYKDLNPKHFDEALKFC